VWGNGISYDSGIFLCWNSDRIKRNWKQVIQEQIDIADSSDYLERLQQESAIEPSLTKLAAKAKQLEEELEKVRKEALDAIAHIPVPQCATVRKEPSFWERPSKELRQKFPELFT
jgi:CRISPR/Cas system-associated endoribonuclease Cas2